MEHATYPPRSGEISRLTVVGDDGNVQDIKQVLVEQPGTDLIMALSEEGEIGLYGAMSECLIYYLSGADAPLLERMATELRKRSGQSITDDITAAEARGRMQGVAWAAAECHRDGQTGMADGMLSEWGINNIEDMEAAGVDEFDLDELRALYADEDEEADQCEGPEDCDAHHPCIKHAAEANAGRFQQR